ncbi:VOC family protein [Dactylosporangium matsuzakiense]|nr:VOC family protein [Dactylosporangium matsuzakiense]UWZ43692.1 VOC family protein [Dactylosporangium matsuzakiense]
MTQIAVHLVVDDPARAATWLIDTLGARETGRYKQPDGTLLAVQMLLGDTALAVAGEMPDAGLRTPASMGGSPAAFHVTVDDVDAAWSRALERGATAFKEPYDAPWGERTAQFLDPSGHRWAINRAIA